jgi:hypothetical protein
MSCTPAGCTIVNLKTKHTLLKAKDRYKNFGAETLRQNEIVNRVKMSIFILVEYRTFLSNFVRVGKIWKYK